MLEITPLKVNVIKNVSDVYRLFRTKGNRFIFRIPAHGRKTTVFGFCLSDDDEILKYVIGDFRKTSVNISSRSIR